METLLSDLLRGVTIRSDNRKPKITGPKRVGRVGFRSEKLKIWIIDGQIIEVLQYT